MPYKNDRGWEDQINRIVEDAVENMDFARLEQNIRHTIDSVFDEWKIGPGTNVRRTNYSETRENPYRRTTYRRTPYSTVIRNLNKGEARRFSDQKELAAVPEKRLYPLALPGTIGSVICTAVGGFLTVNLGIALASCLAFMGTDSDIALAALILSPMVAGAAALLGKGVEMLKRIRRFRTYRSVLGRRTFCQVKELAVASGKSESFVVRDLQKMIQKRFFLQGHLDMQGTTLMIDDDTYQQYLQSQDSYLKRLDEQRVAPQKTEEVFSSDGVENPELVKALAEGNTYITEIRKANEQIPGEEISKKLYRLEAVLRKIFQVLEKDPKQLPRLRKFMTYYMPTTRKLVQTYQDLDSHPVGGENVTQAKLEIEQTLDTINEAYEKLLDSFYEDAVMDIRADRSVLESMLTQDGLTTSPFEEEKLMRREQR